MATTHNSVASYFRKTEVSSVKYAQSALKAGTKHQRVVTQA